MKRAVTLFAVIAALGLVFAGCKKKPAEKKGGDDMAAMDMADSMDMDMDMADDMMEPAMDMDTMDGDAMGMDAMADAGEAPKLGIPECDAYFKAMSCYISKLPAASRGPTKAAFDKSVAAWKKMASGPGKASLAKTCKMTMDAWKKGISKVPQYADCLK